MSAVPTPEEIAAVPPFEILDREARAALARRSAIRSFEEDQVLWRAGSSSKGLYVILDGEVRIVRSAGGRQQVVHTEGPGGTLGEIPLFDGGPYPATAVAGTRTRCLVVTREALDQALRVEPRLASAFLERLSRRLRSVVDRLSRTSLWSVRSRLCAHILAQSQASPDGVYYTIPGTQTELAEEIGSVREVVARELAALRKAGVLRQVDGRYELVDITTLESIVRSES